MIITIGGSICSGKTTLAGELAKRFGLKHVSAGKIMREMAKERCMTLLEFSRYAESHPEVDRDIDKKQKELAKGNCVVDGRLSAHFLDSDMKVWLDAPLEVRAERLSKRDKKSGKDAERNLIEREESEGGRYMKIYGIDLRDMRIYDLIINTARFDVKTMTELVSIAIGNI
jgi:cytidylate kinase